MLYTVVPLAAMSLMVDITLSFAESTRSDRAPTYLPTFFGAFLGAFADLPVDPPPDIPLILPSVNGVFSVDPAILFTHFL